MCYSPKAGWGTVATAPAPLKQQPMMEAMLMPNPTLQERFWSKVAKAGPNACWEWRAALMWKGYGVINIRGRAERAHRVVWELTEGPIPHGMLVCHHCDNRRCVNPAHLFVGTVADNQRDMVRKGRAKGGPKGHTRTRGSRSAVAKLTEQKVVEMREAYATGMVLQRELADKYGISGPTVSMIVNRKAWAHI